jgi:methylthioribose-1-phosphate isomerase
VNVLGSGSKPEGDVPVFTETVRWNAGAVRILDQRLLPGEEVYRDLRTVSEVVDAIQTLAVRGAPAIGVAGAFGVALAAGLALQRRPADPGALLRELLPEAERIAEARPTAVNLAWAVERTVRAARGVAAVGGVPEELVHQCLAEAEAILREDLERSARMGRAGLAILPDRARVVTHCNTGGLATAGGGTALGVVLAAHRAGKDVFVYVDETRPLLQGARLTAWELGRAGIPYAIQCDGAAAWTLRTERIDAVLVGADRIARNGDTANKIGTFALALGAADAGVPFYVVAPRSTFDPDAATGAEIPIEQRPGSEVLALHGAEHAPRGAAAWNPAFDVTPARLISGWITERGVERPPFDA